MPLTHDFDYHRPATLQEALGLIGKYRGKANVLAGGTDLILAIKEGGWTPAALIDIKAIEELQRLEFDGKMLTIGAGVTFAQLIKSTAVKKNFPILWEAARTVASTGLRNRATLVGNICSAVPCMDSAPPLLVYEAIVHTAKASGKGGRKVKIDDWFVGPRKTALQADEVVTAVSVPLPGKRHGGCYAKLGRYAGEDLAQASVAALALPGGHYRVAFGSLGPVPTRAAKIEKKLDGSRPSREWLVDVLPLVPQAISPITDIRATKEYRTHMAGVLLERALGAAAERLQGKGPTLGTALI